MVSARMRYSMEVKSQSQIPKFGRNHENLIKRIERVRHVTCDLAKKFRTALTLLSGTESYLYNAENEITYLVNTYSQIASRSINQNQFINSNNWCKLPCQLSVFIANDCFIINRGDDSRYS